MKSTITTLAQAFIFLGIAEALPDVSALPPEFQSQVVSHYKAMIITKALNKEANDGKDWEPDWNNSNQWKYYPWFTMCDEPGGLAGSGFSFDRCVIVDSHSTVASRLVFISDEVAEYAAETFRDIYMEYFLNIKA